jgi:nicotinamidase-related amidase
MLDSNIAPEFEAAALITIDTQRDFLDDGPVPIPGTTAVLPAMREVLEAFRAAGRPIVHIVRLYEQDGSNADLCRRELLRSGASAAIRGSDGAELASELLPADGQRLDDELLLTGGIQELADDEVAIYKPRWGAFYMTPLEQHLRGKGVSTLIFTGCNFPNCPRTSIYEASERDFRIVVARDAVSGLYERGERELEGIGVALMDTRGIVSAMHSATRSAVTAAATDHADSSPLTA